MKKLLFAVSLTALTSICVYSQGLPPYLEGKLVYPELDFHPWMGVFPTENPALAYDPDIDYKVIIDVYDKIQDSTSINTALREAARTYNLNIVNGVPPGKLKMAVVIHGYAIRSILKDEGYKAIFGVSNPNLELIHAMKEKGVQFYVCGQNMAMFQLTPESISTDVDVALSAKTAIITLENKGYSYLNVNED